MAGIPVYFNSRDNAFIRFGLFVKMDAFPGDLFYAGSGDTTIVDIDAGVTGYCRLKVQSNMHLVAESSYLGVPISVLLNPSMEMFADKWYWVSAIFGHNSSEQNWIGGKVTGPGGSTDGVREGTGALPHIASDTVSAKLGWGVSLSSFYGGFPNRNGYEMSDLVLDTAALAGSYPPAIGPWPIPDADIDPTVATPVATGGAGTAAAHPSALYLCHDAVGSTGGIVDATSNHYDLTPGPQGLLIVADGPY